MSSLAEIYFNYKKAINQANQLDEVAKKLRNASERSMENILNNVHKSWKSDNSLNYIKKGRQVEQDIASSANNLNKIAAAIRTIATRVRDAELEAWRIAHERI